VRLILNKFVITGGKKLRGEVSISGAKNAAIAIIPAAILSNEVCRIENVPNINDVSLIMRVLSEIGVKTKLLNKNTLEIDPRNTTNLPVVSNEIRTMRASYYLLGALLGRFSEAKVLLPGGCDFGVRPIDQHLKGFEALGVNYKIEQGIIEVSADRLVGSSIYLDVVSVGATINILLAAVKAEGLTVIENAAKEPHIVDLANFLNSMGADIRGSGTDVIKVHGVKYLKGSTYSIIPDQIEAGTYMAAAAATDGDVLVKNVIPKHLEGIKAKLEEIGAKVEEFDDSVRVTRKTRFKRCHVKTQPYPGFPTDMQPQVTVLLSLADGTSIVNENVWDNRFRYVEELKRMGANISVEGKVAIVEGIDELIGASVNATDLRAGAAMVIAGLAAKGTTCINDVSHIERGYENMVQTLAALGADIKEEYSADWTEMRASLA
jgi:UDP-N-acetylglucosamine 1-carboxyvinyltransferase